MHDMGGMDGFGSPRVESAEPVFHEPWEARVFAMTMLATAAGVFVTDTFRHAVEQLPPDEYLRRGYYGRWLRALERLLLHAAIITPDEIVAHDPDGEAPITAPPTVPFAAPPSAASPGSLRNIDTPPQFETGQRVLVRSMRPPGHTRLPGYVRGKRGVVERVHPGWVFPDTSAHGLGEEPQYAYAVRFQGVELWGADAERGVSVCVDLFESYLEGDPA